MTPPPIKMRLVDWLDDLCVRFIVNLPREELESVERICFQIEEAQWFYEDFLRPLDPSLPSMNLRRFSLLMFQHCPLSADYSEQLHVQAYEQFLAYKTRVPVRGAIMLNHDMTHAVLVKGWKKGAKWSFPRGKINKDEADLDCAVREVYEETGYDLRAADLVRPEEDMKSIGVSMREQDMMLYVFRGVPMDTHFEPRTRKEISKIDWYKLTDLPTVRKNKHHAPHPAAHDLVRDNNFYMVAPFLGPLRGWIKQQHKLDRQRAHAPTAARPVPPAAATITDTELEPDVGHITADEAFVPGKAPADETFADLVARLGRSHRASDALPEVSAQPQEPQALDQAEQLKRLLNVGPNSSLQASPVASPPVEAPSQTNPLLAMLHGSSQVNTPVAQLPRTPMDQFIPPPHQPHSPHGQHHPRPPHLEHVAPPPPFPFHPQQNLPYRGHQPPQFPSQHPSQHTSQHLPQHPGGTAMSFPGQFGPHPPRHPASGLSQHAPNVQQAFSQEPPRPYQQTGDPQFLQGVRGAAPPASKLPPPRLTPHTMNLLNALKSQEKLGASPVQQSVQPTLGSQLTPRTQPSQLHHPHGNFNLPQEPSSVQPQVPSPPLFQASPPIKNFVPHAPAQPKPRSAHQDSLLSLFNSHTGPSPTPPPQQLVTEPAELSALPTTPAHATVPMSSDQVVSHQPEVDTRSSLLDAFFKQSSKPGLTSATVSGPVNVPDFETVKKNTHLTEESSRGHSRGPSPNQPANAVQQPFVPQQILKRNDTNTSRVSPTDMSQVIDTAKPPPTTTNLPIQQASTFNPKILRRPNQNASPAPASASPLLALFYNSSNANENRKNNSHASPKTIPVAPAQASTASTAHQSFDRRETLASEQKNALLSLFGKPSSIVSSPVQAPLQPVSVQGSSKAPSLVSKSPLPTADPARQHNTQPPTPKTTSVPGVTSPVSPLPDKDKESPAHLTSRSRISSLGESSGLPAGLTIPPTSNPGPKSGNGSGTEDEHASAGNGDFVRGRGPLKVGGAGEKGKSTSSPVDKSFLLGFLNNVAKSAR